MISDLAISARAVEKNKNSITSVANPLMKRSENDLSPHAQPKGFRTSLPIPRLEAVLRLRGRSKGSRNNDSRPLFFSSSWLWCRLRQKDLPRRTRSTWSSCIEIFFSVI